LTGGSTRSRNSDHDDEAKQMKLTGAALATALLTACAGGTGAIPPQTAVLDPGALSGPGFDGVAPNVTAPPKCKSQKDTKYYAAVASQTIKEVTGSSLCVPAFGGWGGSLQFPGTYNASYTVGLTSSTTAYKGGTFPPAGSTKPIFYLQILFTGFPGFYQSLPKGGPLESTHLTAGKPYTIVLSEYFYALGWSKVGSCYQTAKKSKNGNGLAEIGSLFEKTTFLEQKGIFEVFKGELVSNQC
jgi:hypothetical protein